MTKISQLSQDTAPTLTDYVPTVDIETGTTKRTLLSALANLIGVNLPAGSVTPLNAPNLAKAVNRQDGTTNNVVTNQLIQSGWGYLTTTASPRQQSITVNFPVAFDNVPIVVCNYTGYRLTSRGVPTSPADAIDGYYDIIHATAAGIGLSSFIASVSDLDAVGMPNGYQLFTWIAIGTKAR